MAKLQENAVTDSDALNIDEQFERFNVGRTKNRDRPRFSAASDEIDHVWPRNGLVALGWSGWFSSENGIYSSYLSTGIPLAGC